MTTPIPDIQPRLAQVERMWLENHCLHPSSIHVYVQWVRRFSAYCHMQNLDIASQLTLTDIATFVNWYARTRGIDCAGVFAGARTALHAWALALSELGEPVPNWAPPAVPHAWPDPLLERFAEYLAEYRGNPAATRHKKLTHIAGFLTSLQARHCPVARLTLQDIDVFILAHAKRDAKTTVADIASSVRSFLRFLHTTGRLETDLAPSVMAPIVRRGERPLRALPWAQVCRILTVIDRSHAAGQRDYALLLLMSIYGLGAGEAIRLGLDDIDWRGAVLRITRPKTGVAFLLPLLPGVAEVLADYLRYGRPQHTPTRHLFLSLHTPHRPLTSSSPVRHILAKHARAAGVTAAFLGSHVLRHTHACRELEQGVPPKVIGDILGHRDPESTSAYLRIATARLREVGLALPV